MQHIQAHKNFKNIAKKVDEIYSIYMLLKSDIDEMSEAQVKSQTRKILNRLPQVSDYIIDEYLQQLERFLIYKRLKSEAQEMKEKIKEVKSFIYSLDEDTPEISEKRIQDIKDRYTYIKKNENTEDLDTLIKYAKITENLLLRLNFEQLDKEDAKELSTIKSELSQLIRTFEGVQKSRKYGPYLYGPIYKLASETYARRNPEKAESITATILDFIEQPDKIQMFEPYIKRLISKRMKGPEFVRFYKAVMSMRKGEQQYESSQFIPYNDYLSVNETYESYAELDKVVEDLAKVIESTVLNLNRIYNLDVLLEDTLDSYSEEIKPVVTGTGLMFMEESDAAGTFVPPENYEAFKGANIEVLLQDFPIGIVIIDTRAVNKPTILHELQHARDYYVSSKKMAQTKMGQKYQNRIDTYISKAEAENKEDINPFNDPEVRRLYYRTPHEQSAYFVQTIRNIEFFDDEKIRNIHETYRTFKMLYPQYHILTPKDKRKLAKKFAQYYYKIKEKALGADKK